MQTIHLKTEVHGRVLLVSQNPELLVVGFHGYGETAETHLLELGKLAPTASWSLAAVQALHPFYTRSGEVVASWMTSLDRELAIADNLRYVSTVVEQLGPRRRHLVFAGFSQGAAMAYRAAASIPCSGLLILGGDLPPDVVELVPKLPPVLIGRGRSEEWFTGEKLKKDLMYLPENRVEVIEFDGGHEWTDDYRAAASKFLDRIAASGG